MVALKDGSAEHGDEGYFTCRQRSHSRAIIHLRSEKGGFMLDDKDCLKVRLYKIVYLSKNLQINQ